MAALLDEWIAELEVAVAPKAAPPAAAGGGGGGKNKKEKKEKKPQQSREKKPKNAPAAEDPNAPPGAKLEIIVGKITKVWEHPDSEKLFCEHIDIGEGEDRQIASGLRAFYKLADLENRMVCVLANLKGKGLGGFKSTGMVLCASNDAHDAVVFVDPPAGAQPGDKVVFEGIANTPASAAQVQKKKVLEACFPDLSVGEGGVATYQGAKFVVEGSGETCTAPGAEAGWHVS
eukprot:CAMPEP_0182558214 /NCGR_PEP_ID=MMETSP1324-20130603/1850_1 /TAXON_ID=236786 /ORGANISM="Florenciella sp., Strain RCC1587" /LENGTH=230 /DNA_ID=CAMNT_0024770381 /DNA_START=79 /DNA_END=771 /DNA_ORIENTATION=-